MKLGVRRLTAFLTGERRIQKINGIPMEYVIGEGEGIFIYGNRRCTFRPEDFNWEKKTVMRDVCKKINSKFGIE